MENLNNNSKIENIYSNCKNETERTSISKFFSEDVKKYLNLLIELDQKIKNKAVASDEIQKTLNSATLKVVEQGSILETTLANKILIEKIKNTFRELISPWFKQGKIMTRALEKPRGYAGDYEMLEIIYNDKPLSEGFGYYFDMGFLAGGLTVAVRNRKNKMVEILGNLIINWKGSELHILNLACGSCRDIKDLFASEFIPKTNINISCLDQDEKALEFSKNSLKSLPGNIKVNFTKEDIMHLIRDKKPEILNNQHIIYSIGLADYLPDRILMKLISNCYNALPAEGKLVISYKDRNKYAPIREDWLTDWKFVPRDENTVLQMMEKLHISRSSIEITREPSQIVFFITLKK
ncbi:MAG: class I SAM-dependent methyltransferase [Candidatus Saganbacteria bacterium]|nr:class I SAM-dependent methyltransferase [Candidatus Saganbacteria bacterium]